MERPLSILVLTHYFPPEVGAPQSRLGFLARALATRGHHVHVLTSLPSYPSGVIPKEYRRTIFRREERDGFTVWRTWTYARPGHSFWNRLLNYLSFSFTSLLALFRLPRLDVILVETPPIFLVFSSLFFKVLRGARLVIHVADLWVKAAVNFGYLEEKSRPHRILRALETVSHRFADAIVVVSEEMRPDVTPPGFPVERVVVIPNGVDTDVFAPMPGREERKKALGLEGKFLLVFTGTHGHVTDMSVLVAAANDLRDDPRIHFLFVGDGVEKPGLVRASHEAGLTNMTFLDPVPETRLAEIVNAADVGLNTLKPVEFTEHIISVKVFTYMASGIPVVTTDKRALREIVGRAGAGILVPPGSGAALRDAILALARDEPQRRRLGASGLDFVRKFYSRQSAARKTEDLFRSLVRPEAPGDPRPAARPR